MRFLQIFWDDFFIFLPGCERISRDDVIQMLRPSWCKQTGQICLASKQARRQQWILSNLCYYLEVISTKRIINSGQLSLKIYTTDVSFCSAACCLIFSSLILPRDIDNRPWILRQGYGLLKRNYVLRCSQGQLSERIAAFLALQLSAKYALDYYTLLRVYFCTLRIMCGIQQSHIVFVRHKRKCRKKKISEIWRHSYKTLFLFLLLDFIYVGTIIKCHNCETFTSNSQLWDKVSIMKHKGTILATIR